MTKKQIEIIKDNLNAFSANFGDPYIIKADYGTGYYVFMTEEDYKHGSYIQYCYNIDYLNGWLYGAVQAANRSEFKGGIKNEI